MLFIPVFCYLITAITFVFPPLAPMFEPFKSTHCSFVARIAAVPAWTPEASPQVCKPAEIMVALFQKASPADVCFPVLEKGLSVVFPVSSLEVRSASVDTCNPDYTSGLFQLQVCPCSPSFPFCSVPVLTVKKAHTLSLFQINLLILIGFIPHVDCYLKKVSRFGKTLFKEVIRKLVGLPTEDEVTACLARLPELKEKVVTKEKQYQELKEAFVKINQEAASLEDSLSRIQTKLDGLSQEHEDSERKAKAADKACQEAFRSNFVTMTKLKNENEDLYKKIYQ